MTASEDLLELLQDDLLARLALDSYFADIKLISQKEGDLDKEVDLVLGGRTKTGGKQGACVILHSLDIAQSTPELPSPELFIEATFECVEQVKLNRSALGTGKKAAAIVANVTRVIQHYLPAHLSIGGAWYLQGTAQLSLAKDQTGWVVVFRIPAFFPTAEKVLDPTPSLAGLELSLSTATSGATIYWSTESLGPISDPENIEEYEAPITLEVGTHTLTVWATKAGLTPSNVVTYTITIEEP